MKYLKSYDIFESRLLEYAEKDTKKIKNIAKSKKFKNLIYETSNEKDDQGGVWWKITNIKLNRFYYYSVHVTDILYGENIEDHIDEVVKQLGMDKDENWNSENSYPLKNDESRLLEYAEKDTRRINDIITKSRGSEEKELQYSQNMANSITNAKKAYDRAQAAIAIRGEEDNRIADIFLQKAEALGYILKENPRKKFEKRGGTIYLPTYSAIAVWIGELLGQFSDGYWENSRPDDHYKFWWDLKIEKGRPEVQSGGMYPSRTSYDIESKDLLDIVGDRMIKMGRMGKAINRIITDNETNAAEYMPETYEQFVDMKKRSKDYTRKYFMSLRNSDAKKYYNTEYDEKNLRTDLRLIKEAMKSA